MYLNGVPVGRRDGLQDNTGGEETILANLDDHDGPWNSYNNNCSMTLWTIHHRISEDW